MQPHFATASLFAQRRGRHAQAGRIIEMNESRIDSFHCCRQRCSEMVVESVEFDRDDVFARRSEMQAGGLQHRGRKALRRTLHTVHCSTIIDSHCPRESATQAEAILQVGYRRRIEQGTKRLFAMLRLGRDDRQQRNGSGAWIAATPARANDRHNTGAVRWVS